MRSIAVFDLDGTLVDTAPDLTASLNHCLAAAGIEKMPLSLARPHAGHGSRAMLKAAYARAGLSPDEAELDEQVERFLAYYRAHIAVGSKPYPGMVSALERLKTAGCALAVCTNKSKALADQLLGALKLADHFAAICGHDSFARFKPDPSHLLETISAAGGEAGGAVMIGDTATDMDTAVAAGVPGLLVSFGYGAETPAKLNATATLDSFDDLNAALVKRLVTGASP